MKIFYDQCFIFLFFMFSCMSSCSTLCLENIEGLSKDSKYIKFIFYKNKVSLRHYFTISSKINLRYKEPLFLKIGNNIVASFLLERYRRISDKYIQAFFSVGKHISLKAYLECIKARKFFIINSSGIVIKTIVFSKLPDSEDILHQNNKIV
ncbi:hypothetical protein F0310_04905 (plasmid) [Borrelia sp. A-FGy1]|uniref:hypothetical protein n=1 Tax=Borrelia sp. A-FGy1 TaxID=2608247 RepID=UPI0015F4E01A|nr:hypothetical protein [Borrelia sp. A-FGy1]QMU99759.1 hypothetical protein F0310_04905 [Borrelia sp. A-FGy1]